MSDRASMVAEPRAVVGKKVKQLRRNGLIPAVIYGQKEPVNIQIENHLLRRVLRSVGQTNLIDVELGDKTYTVLAREVQQHLTRGDLIHVDFLEVDLKVVVTAEAQLKAVGESVPGSENMGVATLALRAVEIECLPEDLLDEIEVDFSMIKTVDDVITVGDLTLPKGIAMVTDSDIVVARFERFKEEEEEEEEEEDLFMPSADAVEVIKKGKEEDEFED